MKTNLIDFIRQGFAEQEQVFVQLKRDKFAYLLRLRQKLLEPRIASPSPDEDDAEAREQAA
jgi:hypothetical protein